LYNKIPLLDPCINMITRCVGPYNKLALKYQYSFTLDMICCFKTDSLGVLHWLYCNTYLLDRMKNFYRSMNKLEQEEKYFHTDSLMSYLIEFASHTKSFFMSFINRTGENLCKSVSPLAIVCPWWKTTYWGGFQKSWGQGVKRRAHPKFGRKRRKLSTRCKCMMPN
jgi:hypothetical protein